MPQLDRYITITHSTPGHRNEHGEYIDGSEVEYPAWAELMPKTLTDIAEVGGQRGEARREWRIRWIDELYGVATNLLTVTDGQRIDENGDAVPWVWSVENLTEYVGRNGEYRRRFMDVEGLYSA